MRSINLNINLDPNHRSVTTSFQDSWQAMFEEPEIKLSWSPKAHHIADHFSDYFDDGGQALGVTTDQVIEHMNLAPRARAREHKHRYQR